MAKITVNINSTVTQKKPDGVIWSTDSITQDLYNINTRFHSNLNISDYQSLWNFLKVKNESDEVGFFWLIFREKAVIVYNSFDAPLNNHLIFSEEEEKKYGKILLIVDYKRFKYEVYSDSKLSETIWNCGAVLKDNIIIAKNDGCFDGGRYMKSTTLPWEVKGGFAETTGGLYASIGDKYIIFYRRLENDRIYAKNEKDEWILVPTNDATERGMIFNTCELATGQYIGKQLFYSDFVIQKVIESYSDSLSKQLDNFQDYFFIKGQSEEVYLDFYGNVLDKKVTGQEPIGTNPEINPISSSNSAEKVTEQNVNTAVYNTKNQVINSINQFETPEVKSQVNTITTFNTDLKQIPSLYKSAYENNSGDTDKTDALETISFIIPFVSGFDNDVQVLLSIFTAGGEIDNIKKNVSELDNVTQIQGTFNKGVFVSSRLIRISKSITKLALIPITIAKLLGEIKKIPDIINKISNNSVLAKIPEAQKMVQILSKGSEVSDKVPMPTENVKSVNIEQVKQVHPLDPEVTVNGGIGRVLAGRTFPIQTIIKDNYNEDPELQGKETRLKMNSEFSVSFVNDYNIDNYGKETPLGNFTIREQLTTNNYIAKWDSLTSNAKIRIKRVSGDYIYNKDSDFFNVVEPVKFIVSVPGYVESRTPVNVNFKVVLNYD